MEMGIVTSYELRTIDGGWFLPRGDYDLTLALSGREWDFNRTHGYQDRNECWRYSSESNGELLGSTAILQERNGEKRPEETKDYFILSNSTLFEINVIFI